MPDGFTWRGPLNLRLVDDDWDITPAKTTVVLTYQGPRALCRSLAPSLFETIAGYPGQITSYKVPGTQTPDGRLILTLDSLNDEIAELEWATAFKKLLTLPIFQTSGSKALVDADLDLINQWVNDGTASARSATYGAMSANAQYYTDKLKKGEEEYPVAYPVARRITKSPVPPSGVGTDMYEISTPPSETNAPAAYTYFKSADTCTMEADYYTRREEWTGAITLDADIFS